MKFQFRIRKGLVPILLLLFPVLAFTAPPVKWDFKGFNFPSYWIGQYAAPLSGTQLDEIKAMYANYVAIAPAWFLDSKTNSTVKSNPSRSAPNYEISQAIDDSHFRGLKVLLKPHVDMLDGSFRGAITPTGTNTWFLSYRRYMTNMARIAQQKGAEGFCIGTELDSMAVAGCSNQWKTLIQAVTNIYAGPLLYTANWGEEINRKVPFWRFMDYASIDAYYPLDSGSAVVPAAQLIADWNNCNALGFTGRNWVTDIQSWQTWHGKPVVFAEIGYGSRQWAAREPWMNGGTYSGTAQSNCYEAMFNVWQSFAWFKGAFLWDVTPTDTGGSGNTELTPLNKPAERVVRAWFTNTGASNTFVTISNAWSSPSLVTNNSVRVVQFFCRAGTSGTSVTNVSVFLSVLGGPLKAKMTNVGGSLWRYGYALSANFPADDYDVFFNGVDNNGSVGAGRCSLVVVTPPWFSSANWVIYDGGDTGVDTDVRQDWAWGQPGFYDVTNKPRFGAKRGLLIFTNVPSGFAHLRDPTWSGIDMSAADRLELWIKGSQKLAASQGARFQLYSSGSKFSAAVDVKLTTNWRKAETTVSFLTNQANGCEAGFDMRKILGIQMQNAPDAPAGVRISLDNVLVSECVPVYGNLLYIVDNTKATNVGFSCLTRSAVGNISSVTLDFTAIGGSKVRMTNISGATLWRATRTITLGYTPGTYVLPVTSVDVQGNIGRGVIILTVLAPGPKIIKILYDGETPKTDALGAWTSWAGGATFVDVAGGDPKGVKQGNLTIVSNWGGEGIIVPEPVWWQGVDATAADKLQFMYSSPTRPLTLRLFSYDGVDGIQYSKTVTLPISAALKLVATNLSFLTQGKFNLTKLVGVDIAAAGSCSAFLDSIYLTAMVEIVSFTATPGLITNTRKNQVVFEAKVKTGNILVSDVRLNLSSITNSPAMTNVAMTNISGWTLWRYTYTVKSNQKTGMYTVGLKAKDDKLYVGRGSTLLRVAGKSTFTVQVVYDGDTIPAWPQQWVPTPIPPVTGYFMDVTTDPHGGSLCGEYYQTNAGGTITFHQAETTWDGFDISASAGVEICTKGAAGGETVTLRFVFSDYLSRTARLSDPVNLTLTQNWDNWFFSLASLTNIGIRSNLSRLVGMEISGVGRGTTIYLDDIRFVTYVDIANEASTPDLVDADLDTAVSLSCNAFSVAGNITSVTLDLTPLKGGKVRMTNISGATSWRFTYTILASMGFATNAGYKHLPVVAVDNLGNRAVSWIVVRILNKRMTLMADFEANNEYWVPYLGIANTYYMQYNPVTTATAMTPWSDPCSATTPALNLNYLFAFHGAQSVGWHFDLTQKWGITDGVSTIDSYLFGGVHQSINRGQRACSDDGQSWPGNPGILGFLYLEDKGGIYPSDPMKADFRLSANAYKDTYIGPIVKVPNGRWTKVWINFNWAWDDQNGVYTSITPASYIELAARVNGLYGAHGTNMIYWDYVLGRDDAGPVAPANFNVTDPSTGGTLNLTWDKSIEQDVERYNIYQATVNNPGQAILIASTSSNHYEDRGVWSGTNYFYWIASVDISENVGPKAGGVSARPSGMLPYVSFPYKGVAVLSTAAGEFQATAFHSVLTNIKKAGANTVALPVRRFLASGMAVVFTSNAQTTSDADLRHAISNVHSMGMKVFLKPELVCPSYSNAGLHPANRATWFANYRTMIRKYATIAKNQNVELFSVGDELWSMATNSVADWNAVLSDVRVTVGYTGDVIFCATWGVPIPTWRFRQTYMDLAGIWNNPQINYIGIEAYFPLSYNASPPLSQLYWNWENFTVTNYQANVFPGIDMGATFGLASYKDEWLSDMKAWQSRYFPGKQVIFSGIGYPSRNFAGLNPWNEGAGSNPGLQRDLYEACFRNIWDESWIAGTFWEYFEPTPTPAGLYSPQGRPAYDTLNWWYNKQPNHFSISHAGFAEAMAWTPIVLSVHALDHSIISNYTGAVTLGVSKAKLGTLSWSNASCGTLVDWGTGSPRADFTFTFGCKGTVTLWVKDNSMETVNFDVRSGSLRSSALSTEDANLVFTGPLSHFVLSHDGWAMRALPEDITVNAIDAFGNLKMDYVGKVTVFVTGSAGNYRWAKGQTNSTFTTNKGRLACNFRLSDAGVLRFKLTDYTAETIGFDVFTPDRAYWDNGVSDPLRVIDFNHFEIVHGGTALTRFNEPVTVRAADAAGNPVNGANGNITIDFDTSVGVPPVGAISLTLTSGNGILSNLGPYRWLYKMAVADGGMAVFNIWDNTAESIDIEATDGLRVDNDVAPRWLKFGTHLYHYVKKGNPTSASPFGTPSTASTDIMSAIMVTSPGDTVLILDNAVYYETLDLSTASTRLYADHRTVSGIEGNWPTVWSAGSAILTAYDNAGALTSTRDLTFKNLRIVAVGGNCYLDGGGRAYTNYFMNCIFSNTGGFSAINGALARHVFYCDFRPNTADDGIDNRGANSLIVGNIFRQRLHGMNDINTVGVFGNIGFNLVRQLAAECCGSAPRVNYNTVYGSTTVGAIGGGYVATASNNIVINNVGYGIDTTTGGNDWNDCFGNTTDFQDGAKPNDLSVDPQFVDPANGDFRLKSTSPCYNTARPNGGIGGPKGAFNWGVKIADHSVGTVTSYTLNWVPFLEFPVGSGFRFDFPAGTDCSGVTGITSTIGGTISWTASGAGLDVNRSGGAVIPPGANQKIVITGIRNPLFAGTTYSVVASTRECNANRLEGDSIEYPRRSNCYDIISSDLILMRSAPAANMTGMSLTTSVTCVFNTNLNTSTADITNLYLLNSDWKKVPASYTFANANKTAILSPSRPLEPNEFYTVRLTFGLQNTSAGNLVQETQWNFRTTVGATTPHQYDTILMNASLAEWMTNNITGTNSLAASSVFELAVSDGADSLWGHTKQLWATWNTNNLYIALKKPLVSGNEWWDYIAIDTTRDMTGPTNTPPGWHPVPFVNNRRPEFLLMLDHNNMGPVWDAWTNFAWNGAAWQANILATSNHSQDTGSLTELRIPWTVFGGTVPNRISLAAFVFTNRTFGPPLYDSSPETVRGPTNWVTIDPDNDGNEIPDYSFVIKMNHFTLWHDGAGNTGTWETFEIRSIDNTGSLFPSFSGAVTLDLTSGTPGTVKFTNLSGAGTLTWLGNGKAVYQWLATDGGILSLRIRDTAGEAVNIRARTAGGVYADDNTEGNILFYAPARLSITKSGTPSTAAVGDVLTYRIEVTNQSSWYSYDVRIVDPIPPGTAYVANSMRQGPKSSLYASATNMSDAPGDDAGSSDGNLTVFCGPMAGSAPGVSGALAANSVWVVYFQVRVPGTNILTAVTSVDITNTDAAFDGTCAKDGTLTAGGLIAAGDNVISLNSTTIYQLANDRDHHFSYDPEDGSYQGYGDGTTIQVGNANVGGAGGQDNYHTYLTFGLWSVPAGGTVTSATLFIQQTGAPTGTFDNPVHVDHVDYQANYTAAPLDGGRFNCTAPRNLLQTNFASFNALGAAGWIRIPSTSQVQFAFSNPKSFVENGDPRVYQVMLRDNSPGTAGANGMTTFAAQNDPVPGNRPYLKVYFQSPAKEVRGFTGFNLAAVSNGNVTSATLFVYRTNVLGTAGIITPVICESVDYGNALAGTAYNASVLGTIGNFNVAAPGWTGLNARLAASNARNANKMWQKNSSSNWLQVRFRPTAVNTNNLVVDQQLLGSAESAKKPYLRVYYPITFPGGAWDAVTNIAAQGTNFSQVVIQVQNGGTTISARKDMTNVTLLGAASKPIPGSTVSYRITCSNRTGTTGLNVIVLDRVMTNTIFTTNSAATPAGWTMEYSTNAGPSQTYLSAGYTTTQPASAKIKWVRWKRPSWPGFSKDIFRYRVVIR